MVIYVVVIVVVVVVGSGGVVGMKGGTRRGGGTRMVSGLGHCLTQGESLLEPLHVCVCGWMSG